MKPQFPSQDKWASHASAQSDGATHCLVGESAVWRTLMERAEAIALSDAPVLVQGELGSGKEIVARALHEAGPRRNHPFVIVDCEALKGELLERTLFGCDAGAVTAAASATSGLLMTAEGGTLILDGISEIGGAIQTRLLRLFNCSEYQQVGGARILTAQVRVVCCTSHNLQDLVLAGRFHDDLLYRISTIVLHVPPLRERTVDIPLLARHFLQSHQSLEGPPRRFSPTAIEELVRYKWPGNVRELRNLIEKVVRHSPLNSEDLIGPEEVKALLFLDE